MNDNTNNKWFEGIITINNGLLRPQTNRKFDQLNEFLRVNDGKKFMLRIDPIKDSPVARQYRYLYGNVYPVIQEFLISESGFDQHQASIDNIDSLFKSKYAIKEWVHLLTGEVRERIKNKSEMTKKELAEYINNVKTFATTEWGVDFQEDEDFDVLIHN